eukprot:TRINITY_DN17778_c0_g1_i1.p1 TRINITY_DN17778_c0_g1~~TRINITY_DN17778_c0_g1_i1.p1  ORF type:complete len:1108 (+),score=358.57 TRINITY_DN17778_c0_g1_i1:75-3326(+)
MGEFDAAAAAEALFEAIKGFGTDEDAVWQALGTIRAQEDWGAVLDAFREKYPEDWSGDLRQGLRDDLSESELEKAKGILADNGVQWEAEAAQRGAEGGAEAPGDTAPDPGDAGADEAAAAPAADAAEQPEPQEAVAAPEPSAEEGGGEEAAAEEGGGEEAAAAPSGAEEAPAVEQAAEAPPPEEPPPQPTAEAASKEEEEGLNEEGPPPQRSESKERFRRVSAPEAKPAAAPLRMPQPHRVPRKDPPPQPAPPPAPPREKRPVPTYNPTWDTQLWLSLQWRITSGEDIDLSELNEDEKRVLRGKVAIVRDRAVRGVYTEPGHSAAAEEEARARQVKRLEARRAQREIIASPGVSKRRRRSTSPADLSAAAQLRKDAREARRRLQRLKADKAAYEEEFKQAQHHLAECRQHTQELQRKEEEHASGGGDDAESVSDESLITALRKQAAAQLRLEELMLRDRRRHCTSPAVRQLEAELQRYNLASGAAGSHAPQRPDSAAARKAEEALRAEWPQVSECLGGGEAGADSAEERRRLVMLLDVDGDGVVGIHDVRRALCALTGQGGWNDRHGARLLLRVGRQCPAAGADADTLLLHGDPLRAAFEQAIADAQTAPGEQAKRAERKRREIDKAEAQQKRKARQLQDRVDRIQRELVHNPPVPSSPRAAAEHFRHREELASRLRELQHQQQQQEEAVTEQPLLTPAEERMLRWRECGRRQAALLREAAAHHDQNYTAVPKKSQWTVPAARSRIRWCRAQKLPLPPGLVGPTPAVVSPLAPRHQPVVPPESAAPRREGHGKSRLDTGQYGPRVPSRITLAVLHEDAAPEEDAAAGVYEVMSERYHGEPMWGRIAAREQDAPAARVFKGGDGKWIVVLQDPETGRFDHAVLQTAAATEMPGRGQGGDILERFDPAVREWVRAAARLAAPRRLPGPSECSSPRRPWARRPMQSPSRVYSPPPEPVKPPREEQPLSPTQLAAVQAEQRLSLQVAAQSCAYVGPPQPPEAPPAHRPAAAAPRRRRQSQQRLQVGGSGGLLSSALRRCPAPAEHPEDPLRQAILAAHRAERADLEPRSYVPPAPAFSDYNSPWGSW